MPLAGMNEKTPPQAGAIAPCGHECQTVQTDSDKKKAMGRMSAHDFIFLITLSFPLFFWIFLF